MTVKRYKPAMSDTGMAGFASVIEDKKGDFVYYPDYLDLEAMLENFRKQTRKQLEEKDKEIETWKNAHDAVLEGNATFVETFKEKDKEIAALQEKAKELYVVTMYRFGSHERHSYVVGVFDSQDKAEEAGKNEQIHRGGNKYYPEIIKVNLNDIKIREIIKAAESFI